jgi:hypothetical protein
MKKLFVLIAMTVVTLTANAQFGEQTQLRSIEAGYEFGSDWAGFKASGVYDYVWASLELGGMATYGDLYKSNKDFYKDNFMLKFSVGGDYKFFLGEQFYLEGRAGVGYWWSKAGKGVDGDGNVYLTLQPRIGWKFAEHWGVFAGGQFDFYKFKFSKGYNQGYGTIGVAYHF